MATKKPKHSEIQKTLQFWASRFEIRPFVMEALKAEHGLSNTSRLKEEEFTSLLNRWLNKPVFGGKVQ